MKKYCNPCRSPLIWADVPDPLYQGGRCARAPYLLYEQYHNAPGSRCSDYEILGSGTLGDRQLCL